QRRRNEEPLILAFRVALSTDLVHNLTGGALRFENGHAVIHDAGEIGICERDTPVGTLTDRISRPRLSIFAKKESGLRAQIGVAPAVQDNSRDIAAGIESGPPEHGAEVLAYLPLVGAERRGVQFHAPARRLLFESEARL